MVVRVPLLGMVVAVALLLGENLFANAYVAAKQREVDRQTALDAVHAQERADVQRLLDEVQRRDQELHQHYWQWSPRSTAEIEKMRRLLEEKQVELARLRLEAEKLRELH